MNTWYILKIEKYNIEYYFKGFLLGFTEITPQKKEAKKFDYKEQASLTRYKLQGKFKIVKLETQLIMTNTARLISRNH